MVPGLAYCMSCEMLFPGQWDTHVASERHAYVIKMLTALGELKDGINYDMPYGCNEAG